MIACFSSDNVFLRPQSRSGYALCMFLPIAEISLGGVGQKSDNRQPIKHSLTGDNRGIFFIGRLTWWAPPLTRGLRGEVYYDCTTPGFTTGGDLRKA